MDFPTRIINCRSLCFWQDNSFEVTKSITFLVKLHIYMILFIYHTCTYILAHSSEKRYLCSTKCSRETLQKLTYFIHKKNPCSIFHFSLVYLWVFLYITMAVRMDLQNSNNLPYIKFSYILYINKISNCNIMIYSQIISSLCLLWPNALNGTTKTFEYRKTFW